MSKKNTEAKNELLRDEKTIQIPKISTFRRLAPQVKTDRNFELNCHFNVKSRNFPDFSGHHKEIYLFMKFSHLSGRRCCY